MVIRLLLLFCLTFASCGLLSSSPEPGEIERSGHFEVKVKANGKEQRNLQETLIHRRDLDAETLSAVQSFSQRTEIAEPRKDRQGGLYGLKVKKGLPPPVTQALGLEAGDIVTAFGAKRVEADMSFMEYLLSLGALEESSVTLLRRGVPHKVLYSISHPPGQQASKPEARARASGGEVPSQKVRDSDMRPDPEQEF